MSVPVNQRSHGKLEAALELTDYVFQITGNLKYDVEQRQSADNGYLPLKLKGATNATY